MHYWKGLNLLQKFLIGGLILVAVMLMPELLPLIDIGGIELIFGFVVLNYKYMMSWLHTKYAHVKQIILLVMLAFTQSALGKPKTFICHAGVCSCVLVVTGSLVFSLSFLLPVILANGLLV